MKNLMKRSVALLLALFLCLSLLPTHLVTVDAASYIANWGSRGTVATTLSDNAKAFYTSSNTYDALSALSGGTGTSDAPNSSLYKALKSLMAGAQTYETSYGATTDLFKFTDCENGDTSSISSFYSGKSIGPAWDSGATWNREHTWPNSKGDASGNGENDIMMLRPTAKSENGSRGNKAYGESSGYYNPNSESGGSLDLRGDVARIMLYVYVRWGNTGSMWGSSGVMESLDVLIKWMTEDPVDTWELGRNDSVQSITGTRNVFVDYPEFAFLLFGESIPNTMPTPSGEAAGAVNCPHNYVASETVAPTCTTDGYTIYICTLCSKSYQGDKVDAAHSYVDGTCTVCGDTTSHVAEELVPGTAYKLGLVSTQKNATYYFTGVMSGYYGATNTDYEKGIDLFVEETTGGYHLYFMDTNGAKQYINLVAKDTYRNFTFATSASSVYTWDAEKTALYTTVSDEVCYIGTYGEYVTMGVLRSSKLKDTDYIARLYTMGGTTQPEDPDVPACQHTNTTIEGAKDATCTEAGHTGKTVCSDCGATVNAGSVIAAAGHKYVSGTCSACGAKEPAETTATISFADKTQRTEYSNSKQVWEQNGITVTNLKAASTSNVGDYANPARFYKGSSLQIDYPGMTKIVIDCSGLEAKYVDPYAASITDSNVTVTNNNKIITITFAEPVDSFVIAKLSAQARAKSITVTAAAQTPVCQHVNTTVEGAVEATCTVNGHTGKTVCTDCGEITNEGSVIAAPGHSFVNGTCGACGAADPDYVPGETTCQHADTKVEGAVAATCTVNGHTGKTVCTDCGEIIHEGSVITAPGHSFVNGTCSVCGEADPDYDPSVPVITTATISFADKAQRTEYSNSKQVWEQNGITVTNLKAASTNNVGDYCNPARFDQGSSLEIAFPCMTKIEFTCNTNGYATELKNSIGSTATVTVSGKVVTVIFDAPQDSFQIAKMVKQVRVNSITVTAEAAPACQHTETKIEGKLDATCTVPGHTGNTVCADCGELITAGEEIPASGHQNTKVEGAKGATCTEPGHTGKVTCTDCGEVIDEGDVVPAPGHIYEEHFCRGCGQLDPDAPKYNVHFLVPGGVSQIAPMVSDPTGITLPTAGTVEGYTFLGWVTAAVDNAAEQVEFLPAGEKYVAQQDVCLYALYTYEKTTVTEGTSGTANISFANKAQRTEFNSNKQVWQQNGITVTNLKAASSNAVADYTNPARFYAGSSLQIDYPGMTKIEFTCDASKYATALKNSIGSAGTVAVSGSKVTVTFAEPQDSLFMSKLTAQVRMKSFTVTYSVPGSEETVTYYTTVIGEGCTHSNAALTSKEATCTEPGYKNALVCPDCQTVLAAGETVAALGHKPGAEATCTTAQICTVCNTELAAALGHTEVNDAAVAPTCTETGLTEGKHCSVCSTVLVKQDVVEALGHKPGAEATCTTAQSCTVCNTELVAALGHKPGAEATCTTAQSCTVCNTELVAALGHTKVTDAAVKATCTKTGLTEGEHCSVCNTVLVKQEVVEALGHKAGAVATCESAQTCTRCDYVFVAALKHKYADTWTSDEKGHWHTCSQCTKKGSYAEHSFENACDTDCADCGYTRQVEHTLDETWTNDAANHWHICTLCGQKQGEAAHQPGAEATATTDQVCTVCGYVIVAALGEPETEATAAPTDAPITAAPTEPAVDAAQESAFPWWIVAAGIVVLGGVALLVIKKREN